MQKSALIIDDEPDIRELLAITLKRMQIKSYCAEDLKTARKLLKQYDFDICLTDMKLPDGDGVDFVEEIQNNFPKLPVAVITAHGSMDSAICALKYGAFDFLTKPVDLSLLRTLVQEALKVSSGVEQSEQTLIGESLAINELRKTINKLSRSQAPIYISGESGTGKELVARMIHELGSRSNNAFVPVNCGAIPIELMESEFFGHKKGSFSGAMTDKDGLFQAADGGTLFLDEIADLPQSIQVKLLRAIQEKTVRPIGSQKEIPINVRILCATHKDLNQLVKEGAFRQDLFYRINVIELNVLPLRERKLDIPIIANHILIKLAKNYGLEEVMLADDVVRLLCEYGFPGNVRELENILERALTLCDGNLITTEHISLDNMEDSFLTDELALDNIVLEDHLVEVEKRLILKALEKNKWNKTTTAKELGLSFRALRYKLEKLGIK